jgi:hypothetical protein
MQYCVNINVDERSAKTKLQFEDDLVNNFVRIGLEIVLLAGRGLLKQCIIFDASRDMGRALVGGLRGEDRQIARCCESEGGPLRSHRS